MTAPLFRAAALFAAASLALTGCAAASSDPGAVPAAAETTQAPKELTPQEKAAKFKDVTGNLEMSGEFSELHLGPTNSNGSWEMSELIATTAVGATDVLKLMYGGFPEHQKASFEWTDAEVQRVTDAFAPYLYDSFEAQFAESVGGETHGGLILDTAHWMTQGTDPKSVTTDDGATCELTDEPWGIGFSDQYLDIGPNVTPPSGETLRTIRFDYRASYIIDCADGARVEYSQPKHLRFVEQGAEWLVFEYGREASTITTIKSAT